MSACISTWRTFRRSSPPASLATGPVPRPVRPNMRARRDSPALVKHASLIRAMRRLVYTDKILNFAAAYPRVLAPR